MTAPNPYHHDEAPAKARVSRSLAWVLIVFFLGVLVIPPIFRNLYDATRELDKEKKEQRWVPVTAIWQKSSKDTLRTHLRQYESKLEDDAIFTQKLQEFFQWLSVVIFREGNQKVVIGQDGWLFYRPGLDSLTSFGPLQPAPKSVAQDPDLKPWPPPSPAILEFARQLRELDIELILVPVPIKPMIYPEQLTGEVVEQPLRHRDSETFYAQLREGGVEIFDPAQLLWDAKGAEPLYLKNDTHWTPAGMKLVAAALGEHLRAKPWFKSGGRTFQIRKEEVAGVGDLADSMGLPQVEKHFPRERVTIERVEMTAEDKSNVESEVVLLGDSFINIFREKNRLFGTSAGFAEQLARELGAPLDVIAKDGGGASQVRKDLFTRGGARELLEKKRAVVWVIAARDLFLPEPVARANDVFWESYPLPEQRKTPLPVDGFKVRAVLEVISDPGDPRQVNYADRLVVYRYRVEEVLEGEYSADTVSVMHWGMRGRVLQEATQFSVGDEKVLTLVPFGQKKELQSIGEQDDTGSFDDRYWAEEVE